MRLHEISEPTRIFYHGSFEPLAPGTVLLPGVGGFLKSRLHIRITERILSRYRPPRALSRTKSVFMTDTPDINTVASAGGHPDHIYRVEAMDAVHRNDAGWWDLIVSDVRAFLKHGGQAADIDVPEHAQWAEAYWAGERCTVEQARGHPWEYRTARARILERVDGLSSG